MASRILGSFVPHDCTCKACSRGDWLIFTIIWDRTNLLRWTMDNSAINSTWQLLRRLVISPHKKTLVSAFVHAILFFLVSATVLNKRLFVCVVQCHESQWRRAGSDLGRVLKKWLDFDSLTVERLNRCENGACESILHQTAIDRWVILTGNVLISALLLA